MKPIPTVASKYLKLNNIAGHRKEGTLAIIDNAMTRFFHAMDNGYAKAVRAAQMRHLSPHRQPLPARRHEAQDRPDAQAPAGALRGLCQRAGDESGHALEAVLRQLKDLRPPCHRAHGQGR